MEVIILVPYSRTGIELKKRKPVSNNYKFSQREPALFEPPNFPYPTRIARNQAAILIQVLMVFENLIINQLQQFL